MDRPDVTPGMVPGETAVMADPRELIPSQTPGRRVAFREVTHEDRLTMAEGGHDLVAVIPAANEGESIYASLLSLYEGTLWPDLTFVVANNCRAGDKTLEETVRFQQEHPEFPLAVHNVEGLEGRKVGALCYAWERLEHLPFRYFASMDGDVVVDEHCIRDLYEEIDENDKVGGVSARYSFLPESANGIVDRFLLYWQRMDFSMWTAGLLKEENRETYVLGGQISVIDARPMRAIAAEPGRLYPWSSATAVEDMELTWRIADHGYSTRCSATARAWVGHMPSRSALWGQRMKWDRGIVDLLRDPAVKGGDSHYLKEPKRQQWRSLVDLLLRVLLYTALPLALLRGSYQLFEEWWMPLLAFLPISLSIVIGVISASMTPKMSWREIFLSMLYVPMEAYVWFRTGVWARAWLGNLRGEEEDLWAAQARSEGRGETAVPSSKTYQSATLFDAAGVQQRGGTARTEREQLIEAAARADRRAGRHRAPGGKVRQDDRQRTLRALNKGTGARHATKNKARGNKGRFRWTLLPVLAVLTGVAGALTLTHKGWWLAVVMLGSLTLITLVSVIISEIQGKRKAAGKKILGFRWAFLALVLIVAAFAIFGRSLAYAGLAWAKYLVYLAGTAVDIYLYFAWYSLTGITVVLCTILLIKIVQVLSLRSKGFRP